MELTSGAYTMRWNPIRTADAVDSLRRSSADVVTRAQALAHLDKVNRLLDRAMLVRRGADLLVSERPVPAGKLLPNIDDPEVHLRAAGCFTERFGDRNETLAEAETLKLGQH